MEDPEIFFTMQNFFYDEFANPNKGGMFEFGFAEGYDYAVVDGEYVYGEKEIPGERIQVNSYALDPQIARIPDLDIKAKSILVQGNDPETPFEERISRLAKPIVLRGATIVLEGDKYLVDNAYLGEPTETMKRNEDLLMKMEQDTYAKIIYSDLPLDAFDKFVEDFKSKGGDEITNEVQSWYDVNVKD